ncbi:MAG TPA: hypothetical protein VKW77_09380, partial [Acidimicrobiales bacterium]|nr:hypothetical protein [Acidimicrobiales bacterium]
MASAAALTLLAGEPRAVDDALVVVAIFAAWRIFLVREPGRRLRAAATVALGAGLGTCAGALQWLPGTIAVSTSQRAVSSAALFTSGSLPSKWLLLLVEPNLLGGTGSFGEPHFAGSYNLLEVTGYLGILPVVAAVMLLGDFGRRRSLADPRLPDWLVWHAVALVGLVLALGGSTPFWHLIAHLPLFGGQRLQSRNLVVVDFALAMLFAYWADGALAEDGGPEGAVAERGRGPRLEGGRGQLGALVPAAAAALVVLAVAWGAGFERWMVGAPVPFAGRWQVGAWQLPFLAVDLGAAAWIVWRRRLGRVARAVSLTVLVGTDIAASIVLSV